MIPRRAKRDASEPEIVTVLEQCGFSVVRMDKPTDLLVGFRKRAWLVECKSGTKGYGKGLNKNQIQFAEAWRGPAVVVLHSAQDAMDWAVQISQEAA
jgi:Holliday junction resolvase